MTCLKCGGRLIAKARITRIHRPHVSDSVVDAERWDKCEQCGYIPYEVFKQDYDLNLGLSDKADKAKGEGR